MKVGTNAFLFDQFGSVLLIKRDDTRTFAPPGGGMEAGELPPDCAVRELREETGIIGYPVRLTAVYFWQVEPEPHLIFAFRCIQRGGVIEPSEESPEVGFFKIDPVPSPMLDLHQQRVQDAATHRNPSPLLVTQSLTALNRLRLMILRQGVYRWRDWQRARRGDPPHVHAPSWRMGAFVVLQNEAGQVLWCQRRDNGKWNLPGGGGEKGEAPWETAVREAKEETGLTIEITHLGLVNVYEGEAHLVCTFAGRIVGGELETNEETAAFAYHTHGEEPDDCYPSHVQRVQAVLSAVETTQFHPMKHKPIANNQQAS